MDQYDLFPPQVLRVAAQETQSVSWAVPSQAKRKRRHGSDCNMCPKRAEKRVDEDGWPEPVAKPMVINPTNKKDKRRLLVVVDTTKLTGSALRIVKYIREAGFGGMIVMDMAVRCGGGKLEEVKPGHIKACRPHLIYTYELTDPTHILLCGTRSTNAFLGETVMVQKNRMAWQMIEAGEKRIPCVCTVSPIDATGNYIFRRNFKQETAFLVNYDWSQAPLLEGVVNIVKTAKDARKLLAWAKEGKYVAFDFETTGKLFKNIRAICIAFARADSRVTWCVHPSAMDDPAVTDIVVEILADAAIGKVGQNVKYDMHVAEQYWGVEPAPIFGCTRLMFKVLNAEADADLEAIGMMVGIGSHKSEAKGQLKKIVAEIRDRWVQKHGRKPKRHELDPYSDAYGELDLETLMRYCALDTYTTAVAYEHFRTLLKEHEFLGGTYRRRVRHAQVTFRRIERNGVPVSRNNIEIARAYIHKQVKKSEEKIREYKIDPDKPASIRAFFEREELKVAAYTETGLVATNKKALQAMRSQHTVISDILDYRANTKLMSGYIDTLPYFICPDGRVHASIDPSGARSGRISIVGPGMQTIPAHGDISKMVKNCFAAPDGRIFVNLDYKTLEVFIAALWSMDRAMIDTLLSGADFHTETAKRIAKFAWAMDSDQIEALIKADIAMKDESAHRNMAKKATFSIIYGMGAKTLSEDIKAPEAMAKGIITGIFTAYNGLKRKMDETVAFVRKNGFVVIPWDHKPSRIRPLPNIGYGDFLRRGGAERGGPNGCVQGWAADFCTMSAIKLDEVFENDYDGRAQVDLTVHDSVLIECDEGEVDSVIATAIEVMTGWPSAPLKLKVDAQVGKLWGSMSKYVPKKKVVA